MANLPLLAIIALGRPTFGIALLIGSGALAIIQARRRRSHAISASAAAATELKEPTG